MIACSFSLIALSDSDSDDNPDELETEGARLVLFDDVRLTDALLALLCSSRGDSSAESPRICAVDALRDQKGEKDPLSSYRNAIKYTLGAEKSHRIESNNPADILLGIASQNGSSGWLISSYSLLNNGVSSRTELSSCDSVSRGSSASSVFSLNMSSRDPRLDAVTSGKGKFP